MLNFSIKKMTKKDVEIVFKLEQKYIGKCDKISIEKTIDSDTLSYYIMRVDDEIVGFFECSIITPEVELYNIVIDEKFRGLGYSKILMDYLIKLSIDNNIETIFLEVNSINYKAISLYKKYGFEEYSIRKKYYGDNDAILMKKVI